MPPLKLITSAFIITALGFGVESTHQLRLSQEETLIYEQLLSHYDGNLVIYPDLLMNSPSELASTWKFVTNSNGHLWNAIPRTQPLNEAFKNLVERSRTKWRIQPWSSRYSLLIGKLPEEDPPITVFRFSPIGFNSAKTIALVIRSGQQGPLAGSTEFIILRKQGGAWVIDEERMIGIS